MKGSSIAPLAVLALAACSPQTSTPERFEFTRLVAHWDQTDHPDYLDFIEEARPEVVQLGFYGAHFYSLAHTPAGRGYPAHFPALGLAECGAWFEERNAALHKLGIKVVGHFNVEFLVGDLDGPKGPTGFFKFYRDLWDERELGPRPVADPRELLERNADGTPISQAGYGIGGMKEHWACLRNPHWRAVLKAWVRRAIERGVDGLIANYFYRHGCFCDHCQRDFRRHLKEGFAPEELATRFGIRDVDRHAFAELGFWHDPATTTPLRLETLRWSQISNKRAFDEVFVEFGRSLKPGLIVAQWNHLSNFSQISGDERCLLPAGLWGRDESYLWYSTGDAANATDLRNRILGEATLQARFIRGAFDDKPFTLGKYESVRIRTAIAELAANGGAPMGFYARFSDPSARREIVRYYRFLERHDDLYRASRPHAEAVLLFPRSEVLRGRVEPVARFRVLGTALLDAHVLFDVLPDDLASPKPYPHVLRFDSPALPDRSRLSSFEAPFTVRVSASRPALGNDLVIHFVNYDREEPPRGKGAGIADERPIPVKGVAADVVLPAGLRVVSVEAMSPESPEPVALEARVSAGRVRFALPEFLVYAVARVRLEPDR